VNLNEVLNLPLVMNDFPSVSDYPNWFKGSPANEFTCEEVFSKHYVKKVVRLRYERTMLSEAQNHRCCWCGIRMTEVRDKHNSSTIEHVVPKSRGGPNHIDNYAVACAQCNNKRGDQEVEVFLAKIEMDQEWQRRLTLRAA